MSEKILEEGQKVAFIAYSADTEEKDRLYNVGEELTIIVLEDQSEEPFEYNVKNSEGVESYLFSSEFKVVESEVETVEEEFEDAEFTEVEDEPETDAPEVEAEGVQETIEESDVVEEKIEPEVTEQVISEKPVKKAKSKVATKTEDVVVPSKTKSKLKVQAPEVEPEVEIETQPKKELKEDALQGEHIPANQATNYIQKAQEMIKELGAEGTIVSLGKQKAFNAFVEGGALHQIIKNDEQVKHGYDKGRKGAEQYIEDTFGIKDRMIRHKETTYVEFSKMGEAVVAMLVNINPTKAQHIAAAVKGHDIGTEEVIKLLDYSSEKGVNLDDVKAKITEEYVENNDGVEATKDKWQTLRLKLPHDQCEIVMSIIKRIQSENEDMTEDQAFFYMASDYAELVLNAE